MANITKRGVIYPTKEPALYPQLEELIEYSNQIGIDSCMITSGISPGGVEKAIASDVKDILLSLHGIGETQNRCLGVPNGWKLTSQSIEVLKKHNFSFRTNSVVTNLNINDLYEYATGYLLDLKPRMANFICFNPYPTSDWNLRKEAKELQVDYKDIAIVMKRIIDKVADRYRITVRYIPLCFMKGYEKYVSNALQWQYDPYEWNMAWQAHIPLSKRNDYAEKVKSFYGENLEERLANYLTRTLCAGNNIFIEKCKNCAYREICDGLYPTYLENFGENNIQPIKNGDKIINPIHFWDKDRNSLT